MGKCFLEGRNGRQNRGCILPKLACISLRVVLALLLCRLFLSTYSLLALARRDRRNCLFLTDVDAAQPLATPVAARRTLCEELESAA
jgi:hypothetical protein